MVLRINLFILTAALLLSCRAFAGDAGLEFTLDTASSTIALPAIFSPAIDLSGRGFNRDLTWPQELAGREVIERWNKDIGFKGVYRLQYNLWEIGQLEKNRQFQAKLLANYEALIKQISDSGGTVILDIFSTPQGQGKVLDKKSSPGDLKAFKALVKEYIRGLSCINKYNIWYEVWTAPDLDVFFLGRQQEYLVLYKAVAESVKELEEEYKIHIPLGGPSSSWWFRNLEGNTVITPERSLVYELIKFCYHNKLPLDFISWHAYSTDPRAEKEITTYNKTSVALIRDWLSYFSFPKDLPLIVDEWNYDSGQNILVERRDCSFVGASFIPARLRHMYEADINYQLFFSLEDFQDNKEGVARNVGAFWFEHPDSGYSGGPKAVYNVLRFVGMLGKNMYISPSKINDEFAGVIATRSGADYAILVYNYIDPDIFRSFLSRNIATVGEGERRAILEIVRSERLAKIERKELDINSIQAPAKARNLLKKALELNTAALKAQSTPRQFKLSVKNLKGEYLYASYRVDPSCGINCEMAPVLEKNISFSGEGYSENLSLEPYSVTLIILKPKPEEVKAAPQQPEVKAEAVVPVEPLKQGNETAAGVPQKTDAVAGK